MFQVSTTISKNVFVGNQRTSVRLEADEWDALGEICHDLGLRMRDLCQNVAHGRPSDCSFTSALRIYTLKYFRDKAAQLETENKMLLGEAIQGGAYPKKTGRSDAVSAPDRS